jgi:ankyrin repeat protein
MDITDNSYSQMFCIQVLDIAAQVSLDCSKWCYVRLRSLLRGCWLSYFLSDPRYLELLQLFINAGADVNKKNERGQTPLQVAILNDNFDAVNLLLASGADVNKKNKRGQTPLQVAILNDNFDAVNLLLASGAVFNEGNDCYGTLLFLEDLKRRDDAVRLLNNQFALLNDRGDPTGMNAQHQHGDVNVQHNNRPRRFMQLLFSLLSMCIGGCCGFKRGF